MLTDVIVQVESELFHAHKVRFLCLPWSKFVYLNFFKSKVMLSAASPYFKAMFTGGLKESEMSTVKLQGVSS